MTEAIAVNICVQLWPKPGQEEALIEFENQVLALIPKHGGRVLQRVRRSEKGDEALEVHVISFPNSVSYAAYLEDPERLALGDLRDRAIARTVVMNVDLVR